MCSTRLRSISRHVTDAGVHFAIAAVAVRVTVPARRNERS